ncbi:MAG: BlaI/MecI/CopY family transcriptional regulator [Tissierellales bacterium]|jgi:BlaI family penicillinase repressor|nr:BlaI/MecI/CopY family transcriptional regulator [Tissierellales bacterium]
MTFVDKISDAEWEVLEVLWKHNNSTASDVFNYLDSQRGWKKNTVKTLLSRLVEKEILTYKQEGRSYIYSVRYSKEECRQMKNKVFLDKFYKGGVKDLFASFLKTEEISKSDLEDLKKMLDNMDK